jgi:hypothetical protein
MAVASPVIFKKFLREASVFFRTTPPFSYFFASASMALGRTIF